MKIETLVGKTAGLALFAGATLAIWFWPEPMPPAPGPEAVRPVKSMLVSKSIPLPDLKFAATVRAENRRVLTFRQAGIIRRIAVDNGSTFKKGDRLAWLDPGDYENRLAVAEANATRSRLSYERKKAALARKGVSQEEVSVAEAEMKSAAAEVELAKRALAETVLYAPFDGVVAKRMAEELEILSGAGLSKDVLLVQDEANVKVVAAVPETIVIASKMLKFKGDENIVDVTFDAMPDRKYPASFFEFETTSEENASQTFLATFVMPRPTELLLMPGMSATVTLPGRNYTIDETAVGNPLVIAETALGVASDGSHFVWTLVPTEEKGVFAAKRRTVEVAEAQTRDVIVLRGLKEGERVATAGVTVLTEGLRVSLVGE